MINLKTIGKIIFGTILICISFYVIHNNIGKGSDVSEISFYYATSISLFIVGIVIIINSTSDYLSFEKLDKNYKEINEKLDKNYKEINEKLDKIIHKDIKNNIKKCDECGSFRYNDCYGTKEKDGNCDRK